METQINKSPSPLMWVAGIAIILFCAAGIAAIMGWIPDSNGQSGDGTAINNPSAAKSHNAPAYSLSSPSKCSACGIVESNREIEIKGQGSGLGVVGGAVVGGLLGNQVGNGRGRDLATVAGAVGGGYAGNEIEKSSKSSKSYEVTVRMNDGSSRVFHEASMSNWRAGDHVKIVDGSIRSNG